MRSPPIPKPSSTPNAPTPDHMDTVKFINPEGTVVNVPEADAAHFDEIGWPRAEGEATTKKKGSK